MPEEKDTESMETDPAKIVRFFFDPPKSYWPILAVFIAISIFSVWVLRSAFDIVPAIILIVFYSIISLLSLRFTFRSIDVTHENSVTSLTFVRSGISWKILVNALLGAAIPLLLTWFVLFNTILDSKALAELVMLAAMLLYIGIIPLTPALASMARINILKTSLEAKVDRTTNEFLEFMLEVNPLDGYWYEHREDSEFLEAIRNEIISFLNEQDSI